MGGRVNNDINELLIGEGGGIKGFGGNVKLKEPLPPLKHPPLTPPPLKGAAHSKTTPHISRWGWGERGGVPKFEEGSPNSMGGVPKCDSRWGQC